MTHRTITFSNEQIDTVSRALLDMAHGTTNDMVHQSRLVTALEDRNAEQDDIDFEQHGYDVLLKRRYELRIAYQKIHGEEAARKEFLDIIQHYLNA